MIPLEKEIKKEVKKNDYRFVLFLNDEVISETGFPSDVYSLPSNKFVNIKDVASEMIRNIQQTMSLSTDSLTTVVNGYDLLSEYKKMYKIQFGSDYNNSILNRKSLGEYINDKNEVIHKIKKNDTFQNNSDDKVYYSNKDERFKFVLFLGETPVIERNFFIKKYNPNTRFSLEFIECIDYVVSLIKNQIKIVDTNYMLDKLNNQFFTKEMFNNLNEN